MRHSISYPISLASLGGAKVYAYHSSLVHLEEGSRARAMDPAVQGTADDHLARVRSAFTNRGDGVGYTAPTRIDELAMDKFVQDFSDVRLKFLLPRRPQKLGKNKPRRESTSDYRQGVDGVAPRSFWETTHRAVYRSLKTMGRNGQTIHRRCCDYKRGLPDGRDDFSAHAMVSEDRSYGVWCWICSTMLDGALFRFPSSTRD